MNARSGKPLQELETDRVQIHYAGKTTILRIHSPAFALEKVFEGLRPKLINRAFQVIKDWSMAEDIVQSSLTNAYCNLNNGGLYAIKLQRGYLMVKGDESHRESHRAMRTEANRQGFERLLGWEEKYDKEVIEPVQQRERVGRMIERWLRGEKVAGMEVIKNPSAWVQKIVENNAFKYYNQQKKYRCFLEDPKHWSLAEDPHSPNPEKELMRRERCAEIRQCVAALPTHYREIVQLRYFQDQDYSFQAIAEKLQRPVQTITSQASRALKMLREALEGQRTVKDGRLTSSLSERTRQRSRQPLQRSVSITAEAGATQ